MGDLLQERVISIVQTALAEKKELNEIEINPDDSMDTVMQWDSLAFMSVFLAINKEFDLDPDFDDAIHYTSINDLTRYLREHINSE